MKPLRVGSRGARVRQWQTFLLGLGLYRGVADGQFGPATKRATAAFQRRERLGGDGVVGDRTLGKALLRGYGVHDVSDETSRSGLSWPPWPKFDPLTGTQSRQQLFGRFRYEHAPTKGNPEKVRVLGDWARQNIVRVEVPQLVKAGLRKQPYVSVHRLVVDQLTALWQAWEDAKLLDRVTSWNGSYVARFVRGSRTSLSNHAFGSAFDINAPYNRIGAVPARVGERGSVRELVTLANRHGFYWGGHYQKRADGMHFEVAKIC